jgi:hypothetical protein
MLVTLLSTKNYEVKYINICKLKFNFSKYVKKFFFYGSDMPKMTGLRV